MPKIIAFALRLIKKEGLLKSLWAVRDPAISQVISSQPPEYFGKLYPVKIIEDIRYKWLSSKCNLVEKNILGNKMWLDISENCGIHKELFLKGYREPEPVKILRSELEEGMTVADIGANIGYYVLIEAQIVGNKGKIYALEPEPRNVELLRRNIALNQYDNIVEVSQIAVSDKDGIDKLYISKASNWHHLTRNFIPQEDYIEVKTVTLDSFVKDKRPPDFIRMDVEGFEYYSVNGMEGIMNQNRPLKLFMEVHPYLIESMGVRTEDMLKKLLEGGFKPKWITRGWTALTGKPKGISIQYDGKSAESLIKDFRIVTGGLLLEKG